MANLRNCKGDLNIGLDMGTGSVGWAATNELGTLYHFKKQPTWGSRLFDGAETAAEARIHRGQRRRYIRRRWRLDLLQGIFEEAIAEVDPEFFIRLRQSRLLREDRAEGHRDYGHPLFNDSDFAEADYYKRFPTIYHLRKWLMETPERADIRLIYIAAHNIVKHRGNFLREDNPKLTAKSARPKESLDAFFQSLFDWCDSLGYEHGPNKASEILSILEEKQVASSDRAKRIAPLIGVAMGDGAAESKRCNEALAKAMVGLKAEFKNVFGELSAEQTSVYLSNDEAVESLRESVPDEGADLFDALGGVYSSYVLQGLLSYAPGETLSSNMIAKYEIYKDDLKTLKSLVRKYAPDSYEEWFRGPKYPDGSGYDASKAKGYTRYNLGTSKQSYENFAKEVRKLFQGTGAELDEKYQTMMERFENQRFMRRLKTSDNGSIYYQLHLEELDAILRNQGQHYPFLAKELEKIESLVSFRIPYYVGPLTSKNAAKDGNGSCRFAWSERFPGMENAVITPWNWNQVIDGSASAQKFIERMTGVCTYLQGEEVLPKCSLLYEEFCVLNELNSFRWSMGGDREHRFDAADREGIIEDVFKRYRSVDCRKLKEWLEREPGHMDVKVTGGRNKTRFESKMSSYLFFCKDVFKVESLDESDYPMIEEIILWNTLFEDRKILKERLMETYGPFGEGRLTETQVKTICKKRFAGWGKLSRRFLEGLKIDTACGPRSIMDVLREGNPFAGRQGRTMVLMEIINDEDLGFKDKIEEFNKEYFEKKGKELGVNELPGSPAIRRSLNQAIRIVDEIVKIAGKAPRNIFIEVTRDDELDKRGKYTKRRYDALKDALSTFKKEDPAVWAELQAKSPSDLDERLTLYFAQRGKCLYSGAPIDINRLSCGDYEVDHIIPRSYIKDDSLENKALVLREANQSKTNELLIDPAIRRKMSGFWRALFEAKLIGEKKYRNLLRDHIDDKATKGFIARQLVETSQMVKLVASLLSVRYPDTKIVPVRASMTHDLREAANFVKCREANDYHHAHDAFLACRMGLFIQLRHPSVYNNPIGMARVVRQLVSEHSKVYRHDHRIPGSSGFIVNSFMHSGFDKETGEVRKDAWDAEAEVEGIRKALDYRQCFISRMPMEDSGAFWRANPVSPRSCSSLIPLKKGLSPARYGGYFTEKYAGFFLYSAFKANGSKQLRIGGIPIWRRSELLSVDALEEYARKQLELKGLTFGEIRRPCLLKDQLVELDGRRYYVNGSEEMLNATEVCLTISQQAILVDAMKDDGDVDCGCLDGIMAYISDRSEMFAKEIFAQIDGSDFMDSFISASMEDKVKTIRSVLAWINGRSNSVDLTGVGKSRTAGRIRPQRNGLKSDLVIIDQSVTGMFEKRTRIGL